MLILTNELTIKLSDFEGPLDLLLHLIRRSEMDIYDIPIVEITEQYLSFLHQQTDMSFDSAGEYLAMAATLLRIKSSYLLPNPTTELDPETGELIEIDPRDELMGQLLVYRQYQAVAEELRAKESNRSQSYTREPAQLPSDLSLELVEPGVTLADLQKAFIKLLTRQHEQAPVERRVQSERFTVSDKMHYVQQRIQQITAGQSITFDSLFEGQTTTDELVTTFLAILELAKYQEIVISQDDQDIIQIVAGEKAATDESMTLENEFDEGEPDE